MKITITFGKNFGGMRESFCLNIKRFYLTPTVTYHFDGRTSVSNAFTFLLNDYFSAKTDNNVIVYFTLNFRAFNNPKKNEERQLSSCNVINYCTTKQFGLKWQNVSPIINPRTHMHHNYPNGNI
ncbi:hypothetical protein Bhyg_12813 [Pseudolycoriella hygida]|uniref:Uncharacterized protein n=1 Tax=Pseudolycoriella hygida TaxID=35572 RepID=A0A9Q0MYZ3_9DIPT|nr:hypothetical protein Bhyg_12813 [Pseudolycoriella hygida]